MQANDRWAQDVSVWSCIILAHRFFKSLIFCWHCSITAHIGGPSFVILVVRWPAGFLYSPSRLSGSFAIRPIIEKTKWIWDRNVKSVEREYLSLPLTVTSIGVFFVVGVRWINQSRYKKVWIDQIYLSDFQRLISVLHPVA